MKHFEKPLSSQEGDYTELQIPDSLDHVALSLTNQTEQELQSELKANYIFGYKSVSLSISCSYEKLYIYPNVTF